MGQCLRADGRASERKLVAATPGVDPGPADTTWDIAEDRVQPASIDWLIRLVSRKRLIGRVTALFLLCGAVSCLVSPRRYTSTTRIMPPQPTQSTATMMMSQLASLGGVGTLAAAGASLGLKNPNDLYVGLLNSRPVADAIIRQFGLGQVYRARDMTAARKKLASATRVVSEKNGFITVAVTDGDKQRSAAVANAYTGQLRILTKSLAVTEASQRRVFYEEQLKQARDGLLAAELRFEKVQQSKGLVALDAQARAMIERLSLLRAQIAARQVEVEGLRSYSTEHNPDLEMAERELASLQGEASRLEQHAPSAHSADLGLGDVPVAGMEYLSAEHDVKYQQAMFDLLLRQWDAARLDEAKDAAIIQVVEPAILPDRPSSLAPAIRMLLFAAAGVISGCALALLGGWKEKIASDPDISRQLRNLLCALRA